MSRLKTASSACLASARTVPSLNSHVRAHRDHRHASSSAGPSKGPKFDEVVFSGIQPSGIPHIGNYLGLFLPFLELQSSLPRSTPLYLSIVGLHAITLPRDPNILRQERMDMLAALLACGVDPERTCLFYQEDIPEHAELAWILNTLTPVGRLQRMTTWKSQIATRTSSSPDQITDLDLKLGLLAYPTLQSADIMLYKSTIVPVGEDQTQHLELARDTAEAFNRAYGDIFPLPQTRIVPSKRILSLRDPSAKMSKSAPLAASRIVLTDPPEAIRKAVKTAVTDSEPSIKFDPEGRPGVSNLLLIWSSLDPSGQTPEQLAEQAQKDGWGMAKLKDAVTDVVVERFGNIRAEYERIRQEKGWLSQIAGQGRAKAGEVAKKTMEEVRRAVGIDKL
ncbi:tryptophanyl-tRNA synthetase [Kockovaella imperatae]|uniref:tryptophan--tRNA ligase n=1 Tax=Kockovaella imperatae TaxID=4999 RepID=A0A1Y1U812_9TREE|nr:tryptophanyl-tRNA synthetase [Kockovaella imperatae]ORX34169.1 tryptophanyl-tRNA synthetase [Kockovaella imperatae]